MAWMRPNIQLRRRELPAYMAQVPPTLIGMEACGGAHHWGREFTALGHEVVLLDRPPFADDDDRGSSLTPLDTPLGSNCRRLPIERIPAQ